MDGNTGTVSLSGLSHFVVRTCNPLVSRGTTVCNVNVSGFDVGNDKAFLIGNPYCGYESIACRRGDDVIDDVYLLEQCIMLYHPEVQWYRGFSLRRSVLPFVW